MVYRLGYGGPRYSIQTAEAFDRWFESLKDRRAKARIQARIDRAEDGNFGDCEPVGEGVFEMRIDYGPGFRMYYTRVETVTYFMLWGGDKCSQQGDIERAHALAAVIRGK